MPDPAMLMRRRLIVDEHVPVYSSLVNEPSHVTVDSSLVNEPAQQQVMKHISGHERKTNKGPSQVWT